MVGKLLYREWAGKAALGRWPLSIIEEVGSHAGIGAEGRANAKSLSQRMSGVFPAIGEGVGEAREGKRWKLMPVSG